jgi:branched-chain amino acid transport system substrate-binding protein
VGGRGHAAALKTAFVTAANSLYGASGWTVLNAAGDRKFGDFDFFGLSESGSSSTWTLRAQYDTQRGVLTRVP